MRRGDILIQPSALELLILIPLSLLLLRFIGDADELSIKPIWVCVVAAGLMVIGSVRLAEIILSRIHNLIMRLMVRTSRKVVSYRYATKKEKD